VEILFNGPKENEYDRQHKLNNCVIKSYFKYKSLIKLLKKHHLK